jgi:hypothetical protein
MNYTEILEALREFTSRERVDFLPLAPDPAPLSPYAPIEKYVLDLKNGAKPESAAEDLFTALCKDVLGFQPTRQVGVAEGYVDFYPRWARLAFGDLTGPGWLEGHLRAVLVEPWVGFGWPCRAVQGSRFDVEGSKFSKAGP